jgi:FkbM family methyltransferase
MSRPLRVSFITTLGRNVGDEFIREGIRSFLDACLGADGYQAYYVCKHDAASLHQVRYDEPEALSDKLLEADIIIQSGAPVYWCNNGGKHTSCTADWHQAIWEERVLKQGDRKLILNLGAGAGQKAEDDLASLLSSESLRDFARRAGESCRWTTVRDPLAHRFLDEIGVEHEMLACPAFHAARRVCAGRPPAPSDDRLAVNLMKLAGHYRLKPQTDAAQWRDCIERLLPMLRRSHRLLFVAHDRAEAEFMGEFAQADEEVFLSDDYRAYMRLYAQVKGIVANRVHAGVCVSGFGRPAVIIGNDCRVGIARPIGIPARDSADADADWINGALDDQFQRLSPVAQERLELREQTARRYETRIGELVAEHRAKMILGGQADALGDTAVVQDDNGFCFRFRHYMRPYAKVLLRRGHTASQATAMRMLIQPNDLVLDVGAHAGRFSIAVERLEGFDGVIHAFEPVPESYAALVENLSLNGSRRVHTHQAAVGNREGPVTMNLFDPQFSSWNSMGRPLMTAPGGAKLTPTRQVSVPCETIDGFCRRNGIDRIGFLKVDVEGFEKSVFEGAAGMLGGKRIDRICFEISRDPLKGAGIAAAEVFQALERFGYWIYRFDERQQRFDGPAHDSDEAWANYYASATPLPAALRCSAARAA